jgi:hypothetical protein
MTTKPLKNIKRVSMQQQVLLLPPPPRRVPEGRWVRTQERMSATTLIRKKMKFSSYIRKFRWERVQSHIGEKFANFLVY